MIGGDVVGLQNTMRALADPTRRTILNLLKKRRLSAGEIAEHFSKYFGMLITEAKYGDMVKFEVIEEKY